MKQESWKIIYNNYSGITKRAINLINKEAGRMLIREEMLYRIYVLPCEKEGCEVLENAFFISLYNDSPMIQKFVAPEEVPADGFAVKVVRNPENEQGSFVFLTAHTELELFYAAVSFIDDYIPKYAPNGGANKMPDLIFNQPLPECSYSEVPDHKIRSIFTWGHSINDYRAYIDNMARVKLNEVIIWNDYIPINIDEIIEYAHSYGIKVCMGYSWGWREIGNKATEITEETINNLKKLIIDAYRDQYAPLNCDGIYFQAFTERNEDTVGGKLISDLVTEMVNDVADELWKITPDLRLIFGLHASSVKKHLDRMANVNPKIEILWEDCGCYPFNYTSNTGTAEAFAETVTLVKDIMKLRGGRGVGFAFKSIMMLDWTKVVRQNGPYIMGENSQEVADHDRRMRAKSWRRYAADWMVNGEYARQILECIKENQITDTTVCVASTLDGGIYLPFALYADMFRKVETSYGETLKKVARRACIRVD